MNLRLSRFFRPLVLFSSVLLLSVATARAVNHNPVAGDVAYPAEISLSNPKAIMQPDGTIKASVTVEVSGASNALSVQNITLTVRSGEYVSEPITVSGSGDYDVTAESQKCKCSFNFELTGLTSGARPSAGPAEVESFSGDKDPGTESTGPEGGGGISASQGAGTAEGGKGSAGSVTMAFGQPSPDMYSPAGLKTMTPNAGATFIPAGGTATIRQLKSGSQLLDVQTLAPDKYQINTYPIASVTGSGGGLFTFSGSPSKTMTVENPGALTVSGTADQALYRMSRYGKSFSYAIPVANGTYGVVLHFAEFYATAAGQVVFDVKAEGAAKLTAYDPWQEAGARTAQTKSFTVDVSDGVLNLAFAGNRGAHVAAIEVRSDTVTGSLVAAINAGDKAYTSSTSTVYSDDVNFQGGTVFAGAFNQMKITLAQPGQPAQIFAYEWKPNPENNKFDDLTLAKPGNLKKERRQIVWTGDRLGYDEIFTVLDAFNTVVAKTTTTYEKFRFGFRKVTEVKDPDGAALTSTWAYIEGSPNPADPQPNGYGQVQSITRHDGYWEDYSYDSLGRLSKTVSRHLNATTHLEADNKVETVSYATTNPTETRITTIQGQEAARSYRAEFTGADENEWWTITATTPGAAWDASGNLISKTRTYKTTHTTALLRGETKWTSRPDGTMSFYSYASGTGTRTVTTDTGAPNTGVTAIADGTRTVTVTNDSSQQIESATIDIATGLTLFRWEALTVDSLGRPTEIGYGDGTTRTITYVGSSASCGTCSSAGNFLVESETDRNGVTTTYAYDALNRRIETVRLGIKEQTVYDAADRVVDSIRIGTDGTQISLGKTLYDLAGRVREQHGQVALVIKVGGVLTPQPAATGPITTIAYTYPEGGGQIVTMTNPTTAAGAGTRIETTYAAGRTKEITGTAVSPVKYAYGTWTAIGQAGEWTQEIKVGEAASDTEWTKTYSDFAGRTVKQEYPAASGTVAATMAYNTLGQLVLQTDPDGVQVLFAYNAKGEREVTAIDLNQNEVIDYVGIDTNADGILDYAGDRVTKTVRDVQSKSGTIVSRTTTQVLATNHVTTPTTVSVIEQDGYGNQRWQTDAAGAVRSSAIARDGAGAWRIISTTPDGSQQVQTYADGLLALSTLKNSAGGQVTQMTYAYDPHNRVKTQTNGRTGIVTTTYTARDEVLTVTSNNGTETTSYAYDALGNQLTITRPDASVTTNEYHLRNNQLKKVSGSLTYPVEYTYDPQGRMKTLTTWQNATTSAGAAVTTWNYDSRRGWLTQKLYADNKGPSYTYTPAGRLLTRTWARLSSSSLPLITTYGYTSSGDLASTDYNDTTPDVAITYTRFGAQETVTDATGQRTFTYSAALRPEREELPSFYGNRILTRTYQVAASTSEPTSVPGRTSGFQLGVTSDLDQDHAVTYAYDNAGRLGTVTDLNGSYTYAYQPNSNLRSKITGPIHEATYAYEPHRDVIASIENKVGATTISKYAYTVNNLGQRTARANTGTAFGTASTDNFTYNAKGEVTAATNATLTTRDQSYSYDDIGNRVGSQLAGASTTYTANSLNQYVALSVSSGTQSPTYDLDGNQTSDPAGTSSSASPLNYIWDAENRLIAIEPISPTTGDKKQLNAYDAQSRRVRKQVSTYASGTWSITTDEKFVYDGWNIVAKLLWNPSTLTFDLNSTYTWGLDLSGSMQGAGGVGGLLSAKDGGSVYCYTYDANGNVSEVLNGSGGIVAHYEYDAFGSTIASSGTYAMANVYRFSTKPMDAVVELYYYGYRYYNPSEGRWLGKDPIGEWGGINLYGMVGNGPTSWVDVLGLKPPSKSTGVTVSEPLKRDCIWTLNVDHGRSNWDKYKNQGHLPKGDRNGWVGCGMNNLNDRQAESGSAVPLPRNPKALPNQSDAQRNPGNDPLAYDPLDKDDPVREKIKDWGGEIDIYNVEDQLDLLVRQAWGAALEAARKEMDKPKSSCCKTITVSVICSSGLENELCGKSEVVK